MGFRVRKRIKICKGLYINVSKTGISTSAKVGNVTFNSRGRMTASLPGTGISYSSNLKSDRSNPQVVHNNKPSWLSICFWTIIFFPVGIYKLILKFK